MKKTCVGLVGTFLCIGVLAPTVDAQTPARKAVDVCKLLTEAEAAEALGGPVSTSSADAPQGSMLGGCKYVLSAGLLMVNARPSGEFDASVKAYNDAKSIDGVGAGAKAYLSPKVGMLVSQPGKSYFLHIMIVGSKTDAKFVAVAKKIVAKG